MDVQSGDAPSLAASATIPANRGIIISNTSRSAGRDRAAVRAFEKQGKWFGHLNSSY